MTTRFPTSNIDEPFTLPLESPKGWHKTRFCCFASKIQLLSKNVCYKVSLCENFQRQSCSYIGPYIPISKRPQMDCGRRSHLPKMCAQSDPLFRKRRFWQISLKCLGREKSSIIANRKSTMRFPSSHRWTLCVIPTSPKGTWLKTRIFTSGVVFHFFVAGNGRHFKFSMWVEHSKFQPTDDKSFLKGAWSLSCDLFNFWKINDNLENGTR